MIAMARFRLAVPGLLLVIGLPGNGWAQAAGEARELALLVGKSILVDSPVNIQRISVANPALAEAVVATPRELILNGKAAGETSLILWQEGGNRLVFDLRVTAQENKELIKRIELIRGEIAKELAGQDVTLVVEGNDIFLKGTAADRLSVERAVTIASALGKPINLLNVNGPPVEQQILIKVRFADVDRATSSELGATFASGAFNTIMGGGTRTFSGATIGTDGTLGFTDVLNFFVLRPDLNLAAAIRALEAKRLLQILAEPNVLAINGKTASFLAGGEFPYPTLQGGGGGLGAVTIQFREFGIRINFTPTMTPRGTMRLQVTPEVSSLDYANGLTFQGFTIPGIASRRVSTEIELESGQSFAIGGLLDNRLTESLTKVPGLGDLPFLGKLFKSRVLNKNNSELIVIVTPELVRPMPEGTPLPQINMPKEFLPGPGPMPRTPGMDKTGPVPVKPPKPSIRYEELLEVQKTSGGSTPSTNPGLIQFVPLPLMPAAPPPAAPAPAPPAPAPPAQPGTPQPQQPAGAGSN